MSTEGACYVEYKNQFYIFGGNYDGYPYGPVMNDRRQHMSMVNGCKLEKQPDLAFTFEFGSCGVFNNVVLLCFGFFDENDSPQTGCKRLKYSFYFDELDIKIRWKYF